MRSLQQRGRGLTGAKSRSGEPASGVVLQRPGSAAAEDTGHSSRIRPWKKCPLEEKAAVTGCSPPGCCTGPWGRDMCHPSPSPLTAVMGRSPRLSGPAAGYLSIAKEDQSAFQNPRPGDHVYLGAREQK